MKSMFMSVFLFYTIEAQAISTPAKIVTGNDHTCLLMSDGQVKCWGDNSYGQLGTEDHQTHGATENSMGPNLPEVKLDLKAKESAVDICATRGTTCIATNQGRVKCWGSNYAGETGQETTINEILIPGPYTDLGPEFVTKSLSCGNYFVCALSTDNTQKCWGSGNNGVLGTGDVKGRGRNPGWTDGRGIAICSL